MHSGCWVPYHAPHLQAVLCVHICLYTCTHAHMNASYAHARVRPQAYVHLWMSLYGCNKVRYACPCMHAYTCMPTYAYLMCACMPMNVCAYMHACVHMPAYVCICACACACKPTGACIHVLGMYAYACLFVCACACVTVHV
jgi:Na+/phosphate symporter